MCLGFSYGKNYIEKIRIFVKKKFSKKSSFDILMSIVGDIIIEKIMNNILKDLGANALLILLIGSSI